MHVKKSDAVNNPKLHGMKNSVWDLYFAEKNQISLEAIIRGDNYYALFKRLLGSLPPYSEIRLLEAGCGTGSRTMALMEEFSDNDWEVVLLDSSNSALAYARKLAIKNGLIKRIKLIEGDVLKLPFPDCYFDIVWNGGVNEHFNDCERKTVFSEMARTTRAGGKVVVLVPNSLNLMYRVKKKILELKNEWKYGFEKPFSCWELKNTLSEIGLRSIIVDGDRTVMEIPEFLYFLVSILRKGVKSELSDSCVLTGERKIADKRLSICIMKKMLQTLDDGLTATLGKLFGSIIGASGVK